MKRNLLIAGWMLSLSSLGAGEPHPDCLDELNQRLLRLESDIHELEKLLLPKIETEKPARTTAEDVLEELEKEIAELEASLLQKEVAEVAAPAVPRVRPAPPGPPVVAPSAPTGPATTSRRKVVIPVESSPPQRRRIVLPRPGTAPKKAVAKSPAIRGLCATLRLKSKPELSEPLTDAGGPNLLGVFTYKVLDGPASGQTIEVAHGIRWSGKKTGATDRTIGAKLVLDVVPLWWYPNLSKVRLVGNGAGEAIYTPRLVSP